MELNLNSISNIVFSFREECERDEVDKGTGISIDTHVSKLDNREGGAKLVTKIAFRVPDHCLDF